MSADLCGDPQDVSYASRYAGSLAASEPAQAALGTMLVAAVLLVAWAAGACVVHVRSVGWREVRADAKRLLAILAPEERRVGELANALHLDFWRATFKMGVGLTGLALPAALAQIAFLDDDLLEQSMSGSACPHIVSKVAGGSVGSLAYGCLISLVFTTFPSLLTTRSLRCFIVFCYVVREWYAELQNDLSNYQSFSQLSVVLQVIMSSHCPSTLLVVLLNLVACVTECERTLRRYDTNNVPRAPVIEVVLMQIYVLGGVLIVSFAHRHVMLNQIRSMLEAKSCQNIESSVVKVLRGVCDVTVHLRSNLTLKHSSPQLNALLLRSQGGGDTFTNLLYDDEDRRRFREFVQPQAQSGSLPDSLHVVMRDAYQAKIPVQIFHAEYFDAMDELFHIIGILDRSSLDQHLERERDRIAESGWHAPGVGEPAHARGHGATLACDEEGSGSTRSVRSQSLASDLLGNDNEAALPEVPPDGLGEHALWFDPYADGMPLAQCTSSLFAIVGRPALKRGTKLLSWVTRRKQRMLSSEIQWRVNDLLFTEASMSERLEVCLQPRLMLGQRLRACLVLSLPADVRRAAELGEVDDMTQVLIKATLTRTKLEAVPQRGAARGRAQAEAALPGPALSQAAAGGRPGPALIGRGGPSLEGEGERRPSLCLSL